MHVENHAQKEQTCMLLIITWYSSRNCTKLVLKPLAAKNGLSISILCTASFQKIILFQFTVYYPPFLYTMQSIYRAALPFLINWNEKWSGKSNILTMDHELDWGTIEDQMLYYGCKDSGLLCWKLKTMW